MTGTALESAQNLIEYIERSPSPFHACATTAALLESAGFSTIAATDDWRQAPRNGYTIRGGTLVAWRLGDDPTRPFRVIGAHTDSPNLRVKPRPDTGRAGVRQLGVEVYGGALLNSWLDRDLGLSGRVVVRQGTSLETRLLRIDRPILRIPQLAVHLDRDVNDAGLRLNRQTHLVPIWSLGDPVEGAFAEFLSEACGGDTVVQWDLMTHDLTPGVLLGRHDEFISSARIDNLASCWAATRALLDAGADTTSHDLVVCCYDHEEVGSTSATGADSTLLSTVLERLVSARSGDREALHRALAGSICCSADGAHATHPNYPERHEPDHQIRLNGGPVIKTNANGRYATEAGTAAEFALACERAGVPVQQFVTRSDLACGSTIGPVTAARLGIPTFDVGIPQLAMHSARELCGRDDPDRFLRALTAFLTG